MTAEITADVAVLMPKIEDDRRFSIRYAGLEEKLRNLGVMSCFVESHTSYDPANEHFMGHFNTDLERIEAPVRPAVVRDLTMSLDAKPLYSQTDMRLVHAPLTNRFIADKTRVLEELPMFHPSSITLSNTEGVEMAFDMLEGNRLLFKPATGQGSKDIQILKHPKEAKLEPGKRYVGSEFIDTSIGMPELGIEGMHNLRVISIDSEPIGGVARIGGDHPDILRDDIYGKFVHPQDLPARTRRIIDGVHKVLRAKPGEGKNVIAIDVMRGIDPRGEQVEVLCEVNRRPLRISRYDLCDSTSQSQAGIAEMANRWDKAEARMLAGLVD